MEDETQFATDLAGFLDALYAIDPTGGPPAGAHSFNRGGPVDRLDADVRRAITTLPREIDSRVATAVWETALATTWERPPVWVHGDITNSNLLVANGRLSAVLDFGCSAIGDPACDLAIAWTFFTRDSRERFRDGLAFDDDTWARGRGWALWKALNTQARVVRAGTQAVDAAGRFGWRLSSRATIDEILANT